MPRPRRQDMCQDMCRALGDAKAWALADSPGWQSLAPENRAKISSSPGLADRIGCSRSFSRIPFRSLSSLGRRDQLATRELRIESWILYSGAARPRISASQPPAQAFADGNEIISCCRYAAPRSGGTLGEETGQVEAGQFLSMRTSCCRSGQDRGCRNIGELRL